MFIPARQGFRSLFLGVFLLLLCGCVPAELMLRYDPESPGPVRIGVLLPLSGSDAERGRMMLNGARYAADDLNSHRGHFGRQVELVVIDTKGTAEGAAQAFRAAVAAGAVGVAGVYSTTEARAMAPLAQSLRIPTVIAMATGNDDVININPFVYRVVFTDKQQSEMIAAYLKYYRRANRLCVMISADPADIYVRNVARDVMQKFRELGGEVVAVNKLDPADPGSSLKNAALLFPEAILLPFEGKLAATCYKKLRELGYEGIICGPDSWDDPLFFQALSGVKAIGNSFYTAFYSGEARHVEFRTFREGFRKHRYYYPGSHEIQAYDSVKALLIGLGNNAADLKKFDKNFRSIRKQAGAAAIYTMLPKNQIDRTIYINRVGNVPGSPAELIPRTIIGLQYSRLKDYDVEQ